MINKYEKWHSNIIQNAKSRGLDKFEKTSMNYVYYEKHHILPKSLGGSNRLSNLVLLTAKEHYIVHALLYRIYPNGSVEKNKMGYAWNRMRYSTKNQERYTSRLYEISKINFTHSDETKKKHFIGKNNPNYQKGPSQEGRKKMSETHKGKIISPEQRKNQSDKMTGDKNPMAGKFGDLHPRAKMFRAVSPEGELYVGSCIKMFVLEHNLVYSSAIKSANKNKVLKNGWRFEYINREEDL